MGGGFLQAVRLGDAGFADASKFPNLLSLDAGNTDTARALF